MVSVQTRRTARLTYHRTDANGRLHFQLVDKVGDNEGSVMIQKTSSRISCRDSISRRRL